MNINIKRFGHGFPLVFFHGWGFDSQIWLPLVPHLEGDYQLILVDLPGFGYSPIMDWGLFKDALLNQLPEQFALIGWSMGGLFATRLALESPDRVVYLMNISTSPRFLLDDLWPGISRDVFTSFYQKLTQNTQATLNEFISLHTPHNNVQSVSGILPTPEGLDFGLQVLETWDFREQLKIFAQPTLFMFGRLDPIVPVKTMKSMQLIYPEFNYSLINRAAHMPFLSHMDLFLDELRGFIQ